MGVLPAALAVVCVLAASRTTVRLEICRCWKRPLPLNSLPSGSRHCTLALRPAAASEAVRLGLASPEGLPSSRQDLQLKSNLVADPRALHDQLLVLNPYGRARLTARPKPDGKRGTTKGHENFGNGVWRWTMPSGIRPESCRPANVLQLKSVLAASLRPRARVPRPRSRGTKWRRPPTACP